MGSSWREGSARAEPGPRWRKESGRYPRARWVLTTGIDDSRFSSLCNVLLSGPCLNRSSMSSTKLLTTGAFAPPRNAPIVKRSCGISHRLEWNHGKVTQTRNLQTTIATQVGFTGEAKSGALDLLRHNAQMLLQCDTSHRCVTEALDAALVALGPRQYKATRAPDRHRHRVPETQVEPQRVSLSREAARKRCCAN